MKSMEKLVIDVSYLNDSTRRETLFAIIKNFYDHSILDYKLSKFNNNQLVCDNLSNVFIESQYGHYIRSNQGFSI